MKELKPFDQHQKEQLRRHEEVRRIGHKANGIACPHCEQELYDTNEGSTQGMFGMMEQSCECHACAFSTKRYV